jgi:hypothetical protein
MRTPFLVIVACSAMIIGGLALSAVSPAIGAGIAVAGMVLLAGFFIYVNIRAWRNGQGDYLTPGDGYRETHAAAKAAKEAKDRGR